MKKFATVVVQGQTLELDAPGLKIRRPDGREPYVIWSAPPQAIAAGFAPKNVRLFPDWQDPDDFERIALECRKWQAKALAHGAPAEGKAPVVDGSLGFLIDAYLNDPTSPLHAVQASTRATYQRWLKLLAPHFEARLSEIEAATLQGWYDGLAWPEAGGDGRQERRASAGLQMLRLLFRFGTQAGIEHCDRLLELAMSSGFDVRPARRKVMTAAQATRFVEYALSIDEIRIALAQACQFELGLRQSEVIGEWVPVDSSQPHAPQAIVFQRQRWVGGLTFEMVLDDELALPNGQRLSLSNAPLVQACFGRIEQQTGPFVVREDGRPYDRFTFSRHWREIADGAGLPKSLQNLDS